MVDFATSGIHNVGNPNILNSAMNRNIFTPQALKYANMAKNFGTRALPYAGLTNPMGAALTAAIATPSAINYLTKPDPNTNRSRLSEFMGWDHSKYNANEQAALPDVGENAWSEMGPIPDGGVVPPTKKINTPLASPYQDRIMNEDLMRIQQNRGNIDNRFSLPNFSMMGLMKKMIEPNTPEENFGLGYFNRDPQTGRTYGNQAHDVFAGKNVVSAYGQGMGAAGQKRLDTIENTLRTKYNLSDAQIKDIYAGTFDEEESGINTPLIQRLQTFNNQLAHYRKNLQASKGGADTTGGAVTTGNVVTNIRNPNRGDGASRDQGGGYSTRGGFTGTGGSPGTGQRGHHGNFSQGGRIGYANGEFVDEDINIEGPGFDVNENIEMASGEGEEGILQQLYAKYIEAGFPPDQAEAMALQEFEQMAAGPEQDQGLASLV